MDVGESTLDVGELTVGETTRLGPPNFSQSLTTELKFQAKITHNTSRSYAANNQKNVLLSNAYSYRCVQNAECRLHTGGVGVNISSLMMRIERSFSISCQCNI